MTDKTRVDRKNGRNDNTERHIGPQKNKGNALDEKTRARLLNMGIDFVERKWQDIKVNADDYRKIDEDEKLTSVEKAIAKRKIFAIDIGLGLGAGLCLIAGARLLMKA